MSTSATRPQPIKEIARSRWITQQQFSLDNRITYQVVHDVFNGKRQPSPEFVRKAVRYFGLSEEELFYPDPTRARR